MPRLVPRASCLVPCRPKWGNTLLVIAYDDAGGFYDHMVPPSEDVPDDEAPCQVSTRILGRRTAPFSDFPHSRPRPAWFVPQDPSSS